jgi:ribosomal protein S18 acetylase RimI-like enzyme
MRVPNLQARKAVDLPLDAERRVIVAQAHEKECLLSTLTSAFGDDPPSRWLYPRPEEYRRYFPIFARAFGDGALEQGTAWRSEDFSACALWFSPGAGPEKEALISAIGESIPLQRRAEVLALFEAMGEAHPIEPHWYLPLIGVKAACQSRGHGSAILRESLAQCDRDGMPAYLEATSPRSIPLYERFGFRCRDNLRVGNCPPITPMWRPATKLRGQRSKPTRQFG